MNVIIETAIFADDAAMSAFVVAEVPAEAGARVTFDGIVRNHDHGRGVAELEYVSHPSAEEVLRATVADVLQRHPDVLIARVAHRVGLLAIGERAFYVEIGTAHRAAAFAACADIVDEAKRLLPIWKRQVFDDATEEWVNSP